MLARRGIAALIFDRRGEGNSSEDAKNVLFKDLVADGVAIADFTSRLENVDPAQVGIMGFGAGANITPFIAAQSTNVAFIVNVGGSSMDTWQRRWYALENLMNNSEEKFGDRDYVEAKMYMDLLNNFAKTRKGWPELVKNMEQSQRKKWAALVRFPNNPNSDEFSWLFRFQNDPSASLKTIKIPFLAIYGEKNKNLAYKADSQKLNSLMTEAANPDFQLALLPGADHRMFIHIDGKDKDGKGGFRWRRVAPGFNQLLLGWLDKHVSKVK